MATLYDPVKTNLQGFTNNFLLSPELWERFSINADEKENMIERYAASISFEGEIETLKQQIESL